VVVVPRWHDRALDQDRDHGNATRESGRYLQPHDVARVVEASTTIGAALVQPSATDHNQQDDRVVERLFE
jgi:hypothetical protein